MVRSSSWGVLPAAAAVALCGCFDPDEITDDSTGSASSGSTGTATSASVATTASTSTAGTAGSTTATTTDGTGGSTGEPPPVICTAFDNIVSLGSTGPLTDTGFGIDVDGDFAYVAARASGLLIVDIADPSSPTVVATVPSSDALEVRVRDGLAFVADNNGGMVIVDVATPAAPMIRATTLDSAFGLRVAGDLVFVANRNAGLEVFDVSVPAMPVSMGVTPLASPKGIEITADRAYVTMQPGLGVFDISNPTTPVLLTTDTMIMAEWDVVVDATLAYALDRFNGAAIVDIATDTPAVLGTVVAETWGADIQGQHLFTVGSPMGLQIWDVSDPVNVVSVGSFTDIDAGFAIRVFDNLAYVAAGNGLEILELCSG